MPNNLVPNGAVWSVGGRAYRVVRDRLPAGSGSDVSLGHSLIAVAIADRIQRERASSLGRAGELQIENIALRRRIVSD